MHISVAICTWNRAKLLDQTLSRMRDLSIPEGIEWELLVVNNNCQDETDSILEKHSHAFPLRRLFESKQGHCHARNRAIAAASGDLIIWTDDDVLVDPKWLKAYVDAAQRYPDASIFGGQIDPWFEKEPPNWMRKRLSDFNGPLVINTPRNQDIAIGSNGIPFGANMAFRTSVLKQSPFNPLLGRRGDLMLGNDDTTKIRELLNAGATGRWVPEAKLRHFVVASRLTSRYIRKFIDGHSQTDILMHGTDSNGSNRFPLWAVRMYLEGVVKSWVGLVLNEDLWYRGMRQAATAKGTILGTFRRWHTQKRGKQLRGV